MKLQPKVKQTQFMRGTINGISSIVFFSICFLLLGACKQIALPPSLIWSVYDQDITGQSPLVFELVQRAETPILVKAWGYEVEFELTTTDPDTQKPSSTRTPYIRLGPQFQLLEKRKTDARIQITLNPISFTRNANVSVEAYELSEDNQAGINQINAYRLISSALESTQSESAKLFSDKVGKLREASQLLRKLDQTETRMWVESYDNYFTYFPLYQYDEAINKSKELEVEARSHGFTKIELLALQIQGYAYSEGNTESVGDGDHDKLQKAQAKFDAALKIAEQQGLEYEIAWILNCKGIALHYAGEPSKAVEVFYFTGNMAENLSDQFLQTVIQSNIAAAKAASGDLFGAMEMLHKIHESLPNINSLRASMIYAEIAKIHLRLYEFPQALTILSSALEVFEQAEDMESTGRARISLARAYFEIGKFDLATEILELAFTDLDETKYDKGYFDAHGLQANIYRLIGEPLKMHQHRTNQFKYAVNDHEKSLVVFEQAKDAYTQGQFIGARTLFEDSHELALTTNNNNLEIISELYLCLIEYQIGAKKDRCLPGSQQTLLAEIKMIRNIREKFEGISLWAEIQLKAGRDNEAFVVLDELINNIISYRTNLPGVLGAWYWENNKRIFEIYIRTAADRHVDPSVGALESLMAIQKIKGINHGKENRVNPDQTANKSSEAAKKIRTIIANMDSGKSDFSEVELSTQLDNLMLNTSTDLAWFDQEIDKQWVIDILGNLPENSALLTAYVFGDAIYIWVANKNEIFLKKLDKTFDVNSALEKVVESIRYQGNVAVDHDLDTLGLALLKPIISYLPETIFFLPLGEFNGFPLDALRVDGQYLIDQHQVVNIESLHSLETASDDTFFKASTEQIFFAGNQFFHDTEMMDLPGVSIESAEMAKLFSESVTNFAIDEDLTPEVLFGSDIRHANIIHIASHTVLNIDHPELSHIYLGSRLSNRQSTFESILIPKDIQGQQYNADLVVLSSCQTSGFNRFAFDGNLGFVSQFIAAGTHAVIASLWPLSDKDSAFLMGSFYTSLKQNGNMADSLTTAKREYIKKHTSKRVDAWTAFQLFL